MNRLLENICPLVNRALIRRKGKGYGWGEVLSAPGTGWAGRTMYFSKAEFCFQKGASHYVIALQRNCSKFD